MKVKFNLLENKKLNMEKFNLNEGNDALKRVLLMMKYDANKTLTENVEGLEPINEQYVAPAVGGAALGAGVGAGAAALTAVPASAGAVMLAPTGVATIIPTIAGMSLGTGAAIGTTAATALVGGVVGLGLVPLLYWLSTKDTGSNKVKKMFEMCSTDATKIAKLPRKLTDNDFRSMTDDIEDAIINDSYGFQGGTDEEKLFGTFKKLESGTASDFCGLVKYYNSHSDSGDLFDDLDSDIDSESEWKQIYRPIRNCVEDSLLSIKNEQKGKVIIKKGGGKVKSSYKPCKGTYTKGCKADAVIQIQGCLSLVPDGKFGPKTQAALESKGYKNGFTDADITKICNTSSPTPDTGDKLTPDTDVVVNNVDNNSEF